ncbi:HigA family addiction module antitoxin [Dyella telluris]|uniref:HigA family addiction module antidote protein n=1 Tax=Dyella telluris TaxID=2763498 RepID=A0A7G8Q8P1_9GAMM|nr:HigA family addiction module antitoxin [Dyella telluris]QNK03149.1 HigA family addiction module antidote protein [Dyella telluris]
MKVLPRTVPMAFAGVPSPGQVLRYEYLQPLGMPAAQLARKTGVPARYISDIIAGKRPIEEDMAQRFAIVFRTSPFYWMTLQANYARACRVGRRAVPKRRRPTRMDEPDGYATDEATCPGDDAAGQARS